MDPGYLVSLNRPNVHLLEAKSGVTISPDGVETPAGKIPTDIIVYATGFTLSKFLTNMQIIGRTGETIDEHFEKLGGPGAYNCCANHKFPNFFMSLGPNTATGHTSALIALEKLVSPSLPFPSL